ncbi:hypothetical protein D3C86_1644200 [compost metagenome]
MAHAGATKFEDIVAERLPVWTALSDLFLDTELLDADIQRIAEALAKSPHGVAEIADILRDEVLPAFAPNLLSLAGEWVPWSDAEVRGIMERSFRARGSEGPTKMVIGQAMFPEEWGRIAALLR